MLRTTDLCERGLWSVGLQLLHLARTVYYAHESPIVFGALKDLLTHMTQTYAHVGMVANGTILGQRRRVSHRCALPGPAGPRRGRGAYRCA